MTPTVFDAARRHEVSLRLAALGAQRDREALKASLSPVELAQHDLSALLEFQQQYHAGETTFPVNESNTDALRAMIDSLRERLKLLEQ